MRAHAIMVLDQLACLQNLIGPGISEPKQMLTFGIIEELVFAEILTVHLVRF